MHFSFENANVIGGIVNTLNGVTDNFALTIEPAKDGFDVRIEGAEISFTISIEAEGYAFRMSQHMTPYQKSVLCHLIYELGRLGVRVMHY